MPTHYHTSANRLVLKAPSNIILELYGTVAKEERLNDRELIEYVIENALSFLIRTWRDKQTKRAIERMRSEQQVAIVAGMHDLPLIKPNTCESELRAIKSSLSLTKSESSSLKSIEHSRSNNDDNKSKSKESSHSKSDKARHEEQKSVAKQLIWRIRTKHVSQIVALLVKWILDDAYARGALKTYVYDDVPAALQDWRQNKFIKLYSFGCASSEDQRLFYTSTNKGDLSKWIANYLDGSNKHKNASLFAKLAGALRDKTINIIFVTHDTQDAVTSLEAGLTAIIIDRQAKLCTPSEHTSKCRELQPHLDSKNIHIVDSFSSIEFLPDPDSAQCC